MLFDGFVREMEAGEALCAQYGPLLPPALVDAWRKYGFGSLLDSCLKMINPEEYRSLLDDTYVLSDSAIPILATAFADVLTWEKGRYIRVVKYKDGTFEGVAAGL